MSKSTTTTKQQTAREQAMARWQAGASARAAEMQGAMDALVREATARVHARAAAVRRELERDAREQAKGKSPAAMASA